MYELQGSVAHKDYIRCKICRHMGLSKSDIDSNIETLDMK